MKKSLLVILFTCLFLTSCGLEQQEQQGKDLASDAPTASADAQTIETVASETPSPTPPSRTAKKTVKESFGIWIDEERIESYQKAYFSDEYADIRYDDLSEWKDAEGNYHCPEGYEISYAPAADSELTFAPQQMPQALLDEISTEDLYRLIMDAPGYWSYERSDTYLHLLAGYYTYYNFLQNFMERSDAAEVVHQYYQSYSKKEIKKYSKRYYYVWDTSEYKDMAEFQITEGLEWFFLYKEGKEVPDDYSFGFEVFDW